MKTKFLVIIILFFALFLRVYGLDKNPPSLNWDEVSHGYNAYSILKTGKDEWGIKFPLIFRCFGDFKLPLYIYLTTLSVAVFGLSAFSVRLISILSGVGLTFLAYLITKKITKNEVFSLLSAFLTALTPWGLFLSRVAVEANLGAFLFALGVFFFLSWFEKNKQLDLSLAALFWGLSMFSYNSARILVPVFVLTMIFLVVKKNRKKQLIFPILISIIFFLLLGSQIFDKSAKARYDWVSLLDQGTINKIIDQRNNSKLPKILTKVLFNRVTYFSFYSVRNYLNNLSPQYLFFRGGSHYQFSQPGHELLFLVSAPFLLLGLIKIIKRGNLGEKILLFWFLLAFVPSAITKDAPHVLRSILILPSPMIISAIGLKWLTDFGLQNSLFKGKLIIFVFTLGVLTSFYKWWSDYLFIYPKAYSWAWQYGYEQVSSFIKANFQKYDKIILTKRYGEPHEFLLFYLKWNPKKYQSDLGKKWDYHANWYWVDSFDKFQFIDDWEVFVKVSKMQSQVPDDTWLSSKVLEKKWLLITSPGNYPEGWNKIKTINFLDEKPAFEILEK